MVKKIWSVTDPHNDDANVEGSKFKAENHSDRNNGRAASPMKGAPSHSGSKSPRSSKRDRSPRRACRKEIEVRSPE